MHWFTNPPYLRWAAAVLIVAAAFALELRPRLMVPHPYASVPLPAGRLVDSEVIEYREVPAGLLPPVTALGHTTRDVAAGEPLTPGAMTTGGPIPEDWWLVVVPLPDNVVPGSRARLVTSTSSIDVIVVAPGRSDGFDSRTFGTVAVPPDRATEAAIAASTNDVVVLFRP